MGRWTRGQKLRADKRIEMTKVQETDIEIYE